MASSKAPGLTARRRKSGEIVWYWIAEKASRMAGEYPVRGVRLAGTQEQMAARCQILTAEMLEWVAGQNSVPQYDGTIGSLIACYQTDEDSPYRAVKANTQAHYDDTLGLILKGVAEAQVKNLTRKDFARWHKAWSAPAAEGEARRLRRGHNCMKLLRIVLNFGAAMRFAGCADAAAVLHQMRFELPAAREVHLSYAQARAIIDHALASGRPSLALAQALQFELSLRQKDVIGEWLPADGDGGIVHEGRRWTGGLAWPDISGGVLRKRTTKTGALGEWEVGRYELLRMVLARFEPLAGRFGPMVVSERTGRPYGYREFYRAWREAAEAVGVPAGVWNMDSRAGGITEGSEAAADTGDLQRHATHADAKTTGRYIRQTLGATNRVADLRAERRKREGT